MTSVDFAVLLVAGAVGAFWEQKVAWGMVGVFALLKLLKVL